jgi:hypothetical protein
MALFSITSPIRNLTLQLGRCRFQATEATLKHRQNQNQNVADDPIRGIAIATML